MKRNALRIVCNPGTNQISYYFRNEKGEWLILSGSSPLSRQFYTKTTMKERHREIIEKADEIYNRKNKGLDIYYEGTSNGYDYLNGAIRHYLQGRDVVCKQRITRIAVVGKKKVGKTCLIEGIGAFQKKKYKKTQRIGYTEYFDDRNNICWCEVEGMDLGFENVERALITIKDLIKDDLSTVIYCVSGTTGRIEDIEKEFILRLKNEFPELSALTAVTMCFKDDIRDVCDEIEKIIDHMEVFPTLAKEYKACSRGRTGGQSYIVEPFGLDILCTYVFEGKKVPRQYQSATALQKISQNEDFCSGDGVKKSTEKKKSLNDKDSNMLNITAEKPRTDQRKVVSKKPIDEKTNNKDSSSEKTEIKRKSDDSKFDTRPISSCKTPIQSLEERKVVVVGKKAVGKTTLIEGIERLNGVKFARTIVDGKYCVYEDCTNQVEWYEVDGIDLGRDKIENAYAVVKHLVSQGVKSIVYCISASSGRSEDMEKDLIRRFLKEFSDIRVIVVLTMCFKADVQEVVDDVEGISDRIEVIQTLAKEYKTRVRNPKTGMPLVIDPFGLKEVSNLWRRNR